MKKLNFGCGNNYLEDYENYDKYPVSDKVQQVDLNKLPYPFPNDYADEIIFSHVLEHLTTYYLDILKELHRILKKNGILIIKLPIYSNIVTHTNFYFPKNYFNPILINPLNKKKVTLENISNLCHNIKIFYCLDYSEKFSNKLSMLRYFFPHLARGERIWTMKSLK